MKSIYKEVKSLANQFLQLINDEIICYKKAIDDVEEKLKLLSFLNEIDDYMGKSLNLDKKELIARKECLISNLNKLIEKKCELAGVPEDENDLETDSNNENTLHISHYFSLVNTLETINTNNANNT